MINLDRDKLNKLLEERKTSLVQFAKSCGISRQSLYNMFRGRSVLSVPMEKLLAALDADLEDVVTRTSASHMFRDSPEQIREVFHYLEEFAKKHDASLFLIGSRARGKRGITSDWDFAFYFPSGKKPDDFAIVKYKAIDMSFPYRIDVVNLGDAPEWFLRSIEEDAIRLQGKMEIRKMRRAA